MVSLADKQTELILTSSDSHVNATISLYSHNFTTSEDTITRSSSQPEPTGQFSVDAQTSNGPVFLSFLEQPVSSALKVEVMTSNSPAGVSLHPAYEGAFYASTTIMQSILTQKEVPDPSGEGRERKYGVWVRGRTMKGSVWWGSGREGWGKGNVTVVTTIAPAVIGL